MHLLLLILGQILAVLTLGSILFYAPFARRWTRAIIVPFALTVVWVVLREVTIAAFKEESPPGIGFGLAPFGYALFAAIARVIGYMVFDIPILKRLEEYVRVRGARHKPVTIIFVSSLVIALGVIWAFFASNTTDMPNPRPPQEATDVHFLQYNDWRTSDYVYRFDAPPQVCEEFTIKLMNHKSFHSKTYTITTNTFTEFPVESRHFPSWFDVSTVKRGLLISKDDWIYAVIDLDRGRLYYYDSHYNE